MANVQLAQFIVPIYSELVAPAIFTLLTYALPILAACAAVGIGGFISGVFNIFNGISLFEDLK